MVRVRSLILAVMVACILASEADASPNPPTRTITVMSFWDTTAIEYAGIKNYSGQFANAECYDQFSVRSCYLGDGWAWFTFTVPYAADVDCLGSLTAVVSHQGKLLRVSGVSSTNTCDSPFTVVFVYFVPTVTQVN